MRPPPRPGDLDLGRTLAERAHAVLAPLQTSHPEDAVRDLARQQLAALAHQ